MNNTKNLIDTLRSRNVFAGYYKSGESVDTVKKLIIETLRPFFQNYDSLEKHSINYLAPDYVNFIRIQSEYHSIESDIKLVLDTYNNALLKDSETMYQVFKTLISDNIEAGNRFWTFINLENEKSSLGLYEYTKEVLIILMMLLRAS